MRWVVRFAVIVGVMQIPTDSLAQDAGTEPPRPSSGDESREAATDDASNDLSDDLESLLEPEERVIPDVVVTGSRVEESAASAAVRTEVIGRAEIEESGARDAAELLEERGALQVQRSFRGTELWLRGLAPEYTLVLVDGDRIPGRTGGAIDLSRFGVENLERIEIVRGPSSALYGSDAIGGVVNLITRDADREFETDALFAYGLNHVIDATGRVAGRPTEGLRLRVDGGFHFADAFRRADDDGTVSEATAGSARLQWSLGGRVDVDPDSRNRVRAQADYVQRTLTGVDEGAGSALFDRTQAQEELHASVAHQLRGSDGLYLLTRFSYSLFREQYLNDQRGSDQLDSYEDNREHIGQLTTVVRFLIQELGTHTVTAGFEEMFQVLESDRLSQRGNRQRFAVFAQDEWVPWQDGDASLTVVPGLRFDLDSQFGDQISPKLSLRFDPVSQVVLRASYGRGFRAPSFQELLLRFENPTVGYVVTGNPALGAETSHGVDVSAAWEPIDALGFELGFFRNDLEDMIAVVTREDDGVGGSRFSYDNLSSAWTMGLEASARARVDEYLGVSASYTLTETWDGENERHLEGRARHRVTVSLRLAYEPWEISFVARGALMLDREVYVDPDGDGVDESVFPGPIAQVDLRLSKTFTRRLELFVGIDNLLDAGDAYSVFRPFSVYGGARGRY